MPKDAFSSAEACTPLPSLFDIESWKHLLHVLEQKQAMLVNLRADAILIGALKMLQVHTRKAFPTEWAITHAALGIVYTELGDGAGERDDMLESALEHYQQALQVLTEETFPGYWAIIQQGLCVTYLLKQDGDIADNLQQSIVRGQAALRVLTRTAYPFEWAGAHTHLGEAYRQATLHADLQDLYSGRSVMQEQALRHLEAALQVYTMYDYPLEWAKVQHFQSMLYLDRVQGKRDENLERSRHCLETALQVLSHEFSLFVGSEARTWLDCSVFWQSLSKFSAGH
jgi:tetratricopeptide (TPR) repeat protein